MELLMAVIALGGRSVYEEMLTEKLWPDADGDSAHNSLAINLHRLRKLLGNESIISLNNKILSLDVSRVWVDIWAMGELTRQIQENCLTESLSCSASLKLIDLYHGPFLGKEGEAYSWAQSFREQLRNKFRRSLVKCGESLIKAGKQEDAINIFEKGIELDETVEQYYYLLMIAYQSLGLESESIRVYFRCKRIITSIHHIPLSSQIEILYNQLQGL
jgi:two-component SAPR family response regulator